MAISGSLVGGYTTWDVGRRGGEDALHRHVPARILKRVVAWVKHHPILACLFPPVLPPPIPLLPFALASGALGVSRSRFLIVYGAACTLRYSLIAWLGVVYGRHVIQLWSGTLQRSVGSAAWRTSGCRRLLRDMEDTWSAQISYYGKPYIANQKGSCGLSSNGRYLLFLMFISVLAAYSSRALLEFRQKKSGRASIPGRKRTELKINCFCSGDPAPSAVSAVVAETAMPAAVTRASVTTAASVAGVSALLAESGQRSISCCVNF